MKEIELDYLYEDYISGSIYPKGSKHGIGILYKNHFKTFFDFCEYVKNSGYIIL